MTDAILEKCDTIDASLTSENDVGDAEVYLIRLLESNDFDDYLTLRHMALTEFPHLFEFYPEEDLAIQSDAKRAEFSAMAGIGAFREDELVGMVFLSRVPLRKIRHRGYLTWLYVKPECRGASLASKLMDRAISLATEIGFQQLECIVYETGSAVISMHKRNGFQEFARIPNAIIVDDQNHDMFVLVRDISGQSSK